ncbi:hypothetical protein PINS_up009498 [Pythium insidiosum]|nr:hypothetical protein PINS_up009498 [Pythium insidiosum]
MTMLTVAAGHQRQRAMDAPLSRSTVDADRHSPAKADKMKLEQEQEKDEVEAQEENGESSQRLQCEDCGRRPATLRCDACELRFCDGCAVDVHRVGKLQVHAVRGCFVRLKKAADVATSNQDERSEEEGEEEDQEQRTWTRDASTSNQDETHALDPVDLVGVDKLLQDAGDERSPERQDVTAGSVVLDQDDDAGQDIADPDQEKSPTPPNKSESFGLWSGWNVRSFHDRSISLDASDDWRAFESLTIDKQPVSPPSSLSAELPLTSIKESFHSLVFTTTASTTPAVSEAKRSLRPRSFSDYTSFGSSSKLSNDIWGDSRASFDAPPALSPTRVDLEQTFRTTIASRHVVIKSLLGQLDSREVDRIFDALNVFGPLATSRDDFILSGVIFCTFFELKAAIAAVKLWRTHPAVCQLVVTESIAFSLPYEVPNETNSATVAVELECIALSVNDMRQLCSQYGEVASVLQNDTGKFIVEFNDTRVVDRAMRKLCTAFPHAGVSVMRSHPPTVDMAKIQVFQTCTESLLSSQTSPTSTLSLPFDDVNHEPTRPTRRARERSESDTTELIGSASTSRFASTFASREAAAVTGTTDWDRHTAARPRSSSEFVLPTSPPSYDLENSPNVARFSSFAATRYPNSTPHFNQQARSPQASIHEHPFHQRVLHGAGVGARFNTTRSGSDPTLRTANSYNAVTTGRNDQGTGEYSLSIERVISGEDKRTTLMIRNIPNKYTQQMLLSEINVHHHGKYDFFYLPIDFKNKCNMGYAFINFIDAESIVSFYEEFDSQKWTNFNSEKVCAISYARLQGKQAMITRFQNSSLLEKHESYRPLVFHSSGPNRGEPEPFPSPKLHAHKKPYSQPGVHNYLPGFGGFASVDDYPLSLADPYSAHQYLHLASQRQFSQHPLHQHAQFLRDQALLMNAQMAAAAMLHGVARPNVDNSGQSAFATARNYDDSGRCKQNGRPAASFS